MSNRKIALPTIPPLEHERPIFSMNGYVFSNPAYHARHDDLWPPKAGQALPPPEFRAAIDLYLGNFCRPVKTIAMEVRCFACNEDLTLPYAQGQKPGMFSTHLKIDRESPSHEAKCGNCGWPIRCKHTISPLPPRPAFPLLVELEFFPMCYHPSATDRKGLVH